MDVVTALCFEAELARAWQEAGEAEAWVALRYVRCKHDTAADLMGVWEDRRAPST